MGLFVGNGGSDLTSEVPTLKNHTRKESGTTPESSEDLHSKKVKNYTRKEWKTTLEKSEKLFSKRVKNYTRKEWKTTLEKSEELHSKRVKNYEPESGYSLEMGVGGADLTTEVNCEESCGVTQLVDVVITNEN